MTLNYETTATIKTNADVLAGGYARVLADSKVNGSVKANGDGKGFGADGSATATINVGNGARRPTRRSTSRAAPG